MTSSVGESGTLVTSPEFEWTKVKVVSGDSSFFDSTRGKSGQKLQLFYLDSERLIASAGVVVPTLRLFFQIPFLSSQPAKIHRGITV